MIAAKAPVLSWLQLQEVQCLNLAEGLGVPAVRLSLGS